MTHGLHFKLSYHGSCCFSRVCAGNGDLENGCFGVGWMEKAPSRSIVTFVVPCRL